MVVVGPAGVGKSFFLNMLSGLDPEGSNGDPDRQEIGESHF